MIKARHYGLSAITLESSMYIITLSESEEMFNFLFASCLITMIEFVFAISSSIERFSSMR